MKRIFLGQFSAISFDKQRMTFIQGQSNSTVAIAILGSIIFLIGSIMVILKALLLWTPIILLIPLILSYGFMKTEYRFDLINKNVSKTLIVFKWVLKSKRIKSLPTGNLKLDVFTDDAGDIGMMLRNSSKILEFNSYETAIEFKKMVNKNSSDFNVEATQEFKNNKLIRFM